VHILHASSAHHATPTSPGGKERLRQQLSGRGHRDRAGGACDDYRLLFAGRFTPSVGGRAKPVLPTRPCSGRR